MPDSRTIVVVHPDCSAGEMIKLALNAYGHLVLWTNDPQDGLRLIRDYDPHMVMHNWSLPDMPPGEFDASIRRDHDAGRLPIVIFSDTQIQPDYVRAYDISAQVSMPLNVAEFIACVHRLLGQPKTQQEPDEHVR